MPWVDFSRDFDWRVPGAKSKTTIAYKAGMKVLVKQQCADEAEAAGALVSRGKDEPDHKADEDDAEKHAERPGKVG